VTALKGKLLFGENIKHNLVHQERFYTRHQVYDRNNIFNQILIKALNTIPMVFNNPFLNDRVYTLLNSFPEMDDIRVTPDTFSKLVFDRKSAGYEEAISIAAMILLNFRPDIQKGHNHVLAILFDMNDLWEEYVFRQLIKQYNAVRQVHRTIWRKDAVDQSVTKSVRPDIVLLSDDKTLIVDTKWKLPEYDIPGDADLKQMFVYNEYWEGANSVLMYPKETGSHTYSEGHFVLGGSVKENSENQRHRCGILKASVLQANSTEPHHYLNMDFGNSIIQQLREQKLI
jgi:5-methylcytosine-specific restriction enzyme subunit McrC